MYGSISLFVCTKGYPDRMKGKLVDRPNKFFNYIKHIKKKRIRLHNSEVKSQNITIQGKEQTSLNKPSNSTYNKRYPALKMYIFVVYFLLTFFHALKTQTTKSIIEILVFLC